MALDRVLKAIDRCIGLDSFGIVCHQTEPGDPEYRLHFEIIPYKHYGGAERGFEEYVVEVAPEHAAGQLRETMD